MKRFISPVLMTAMLFNFAAIVPAEKAAAAANEKYLDFTDFDGKKLSQRI